MNLTVDRDFVVILSVTQIYFTGMHTRQEPAEIRSHKTELRVFVALKLSVYIFFDANIFEIILDVSVLLQKHILSMLLYAISPNDDFHVRRIIGVLSINLYHL